MLFSASTVALIGLGIETAVGLTDGSKNAFAAAIAVSGSDVYVAGYEFSGAHNVAKYWKNGTAVGLTDGNNSAYAGSIAVSGSNVYVAGYEYNDLSHTVAKYWKNGSPVLLSDGTSSAIANSIALGF